MTRSPIKRGKPLARGKAIARKAGKRGKAKRYRPNAVGFAFDVWVRVTVSASASDCYRCNGETSDCAHVFRLGAGSSRYRWSDWRNWPGARVRLCRKCHVALDEGHTWAFSAEFLRLAEAAAKEQCDLYGPQWDERAAKAEAKRLARKRAERRAA